MNVQMAHCLPGSSAIVDADVVPGRAELRVKLLLRRLEKAEHRRALVRCDVKERSHMPDGDHERMTGADRVGIAECERETIARQYALRRQRAEGASVAAVHTARVQAARQPLWGCAIWLNFGRAGWAGVSLGLVADVRVR